jgi:hypothetical protein
MTERIDALTALTENRIQSIETDVVSPDTAFISAHEGVYGSALYRVDGIGLAPNDRTLAILVWIDDRGTIHFPDMSAAGYRVTAMKSSGEVTFTYRLHDGAVFTWSTTPCPGTSREHVLYEADKAFFTDYMNRIKPDNKEHSNAS